jgi:hypothetical protein
MAAVRRKGMGLHASRRELSLMTHLPPTDPNPYPGGAPFAAERRICHGRVGSLLMLLEQPDVAENAPGREQRSYNTGMAAPDDEIFRYVTDVELQEAMGMRLGASGAKLRGNIPSRLFARLSQDKFIQNRALIFTRVPVFAGMLEDVFSVHAGGSSQVCAALTYGLGGHCDQRAQQKPADFRCGSAYPSDDKLKVLRQRRQPRQTTTSVSSALTVALPDVIMGIGLQDHPSAPPRNQCWLRRMRSALSTRRRAKPKPGPSPALFPPSAQQRPS